MIEFESIDITCTGSLEAVEEEVVTGIGSSGGCGGVDTDKLHRGRGGGKGSRTSRPGAAGGVRGIAAVVIGSTGGSQLEI